MNESPIGVETMKGSKRVFVLISKSTSICRFVKKYVPPQSNKDEYWRLVAYPWLYPKKPHDPVKSKGHRTYFDLSTSCNNEAPY